MSDRERESIIAVGVIGIPMIFIWFGSFPSLCEFTAIIIGTVIVAAFIPGFIPDEEKKETDEK